MPSYTTSVAAATAVVGYDLLTAEPQARSPKNRALMSVAYTGSAVIGDTKIDMFIDEVRVGSFYNSALLTPQTDRDRQALEALFVPAGAQLRAIVTDAPASNPVYLQVGLQDV